MKQPNSLKEYLKNNNMSISSLRSEAGLYDPQDYVAKYGNLIDQDDDEEKYLEAWEDKFEEIMNDRFDDFKKKYSKLSNPIILYRAIKLKDISKLDRNNLGVYWTDNKNSADTYGEYTKSDAGIFILKAEVPKDKIDWDFTIKNNLNTNFGDDEQEINIEENSQVKVLDIYDPDDKSLSISFVGNVGKIGGKKLHESDSFFKKYIQFYYYNSDYNEGELEESVINEEPNVPQAAPTPPPGPQGINQPANPEKANLKRKQMGQKANNWLKSFGRVMPNVSRELQTGNLGQNASTFFTLIAQMPKQDWYKYYFRQ